MATTTGARPSSRNVLFAYIGWAARYDGKEWVRGSHGWLSANGNDCSEMGAFVRRRGRYTCGIGSGAVDVGPMDVVFVAKRPGTRVRSVVGLYRDAEAAPWPYFTDNNWFGASTRTATLIPEFARFPVPEWPGSTGVRRWALRDGRVASAPLLAVYRRVVALTNALASGETPAPDPLADDEESAFEGQLRRRFVAHRNRERGLRDARIQLALRENDGRLVCEVRGCRFDFLEAYGDLGAGYAQVHHTKPLAAASPKGSKTSLRDLAVVCANCHAMIHRGGECRALAAIRVHRQRRR